MFIRPTRVVTSANNTVSVSCVATGSPPLSVSWATADDTPLPDGISLIGTQLVIPSLAARHVKRYVCSATNANGYDSQTLTVELQGTYFCAAHSMCCGQSSELVLYVRLSSHLPSLYCACIESMSKIVLYSTIWAIEL